MISCEHLASLEIISAVPICEVNVTVAIFSSIFKCHFSKLCLFAKPRQISILSFVINALH